MPEHIWDGSIEVYIVSRGHGKGRRLRLFFDYEQAMEVQRTTPGATIESFTVYLAADGSLNTSNIVGAWRPKSVRR